MVNTSCVDDLWTIRCNIVKMLKSRGYHVDAKTAAVSEEQFQALFVANKKWLRCHHMSSYLVDVMQMCVPKKSDSNKPNSSGRDQLTSCQYRVEATKPSDDTPKLSCPVPADSVVVVCFGDHNPGVEPVRSLVAYLNYLAADHVILLVNGSLTPSAYNELESAMQGKELELFSVNMLMFDFMSSVYNPQVRALSDEEAVAMYQTTRWKLEHMPGIACHDSLVQYYNFKRGQTVEMWDKTDTGYQRYWRVVGNVK